MPKRTAVALKTKEAAKREKILKRKFSIALSGKTVAAFDDLKKLTDADTDSEVFRNALRLHSTLLHAQMSGKQLYIQDGDNKSIIPVSLFAEKEISP